MDNVSDDGPEEVARFSDLWSDTGRYVLVRRPDSTGDLDLLILDREGPSAVLIDDDELCVAVIRRMINEGVPILDEPP